MQPDSHLLYHFPQSYLRMTMVSLTTFSLLQQEIYLIFKVSVIRPVISFLKHQIPYKYIAIQPGVFVGELQ